MTACAYYGYYELNLKSKYCTLITLTTGIVLANMLG